MSKKSKAVLMHTLEAAVVFSLAAGVMYVFPEHATTAGLIALAALSSLAKYARVSENVPVPDFVNGKTK